MDRKNKYGLSRIIPRSVKRIVRKRCGYGCILCGELFCQYHHFNPLFNEAKKHDPDGITLLCLKHHDAVTNGRISMTKVSQANSNPFCVTNKQAKYLFEDFEYPLEVGLGGLVFITPDGVLLRADGESLLSLKKDEDGIALLCGYFSSPNGETLVIEDNELVASTGHWDIESSGKEITIRNAPREIIFHLVFNPPHRVQILKIVNHYKGHVIDTEFSKKLYLLSASGASINFASGFIAIGGGVEFDRKKGITLTGGSLVMGSERENDFKGTTIDFLINQVRGIREKSRRQQD